jgi:hypothetical protein
VLAHPEAERAGVRYEGLPSAETDAQVWADERIVAAWKECLEIR